LTLIRKLLSWARASGAHAIIVCCPLCQSNLDIYQPELQRQQGWDWSLPILYYTELLGIAFGMDAVDRGLKCHMVDPAPIIAGAVASGGKAYS
jgi:heterodisulfide reductase subunit B